MLWLQRIAKEDLIGFSHQFLCVCIRKAKSVTLTAHTSIFPLFLRYAPRAPFSLRQFASCSHMGIDCVSRSAHARLMTIVFGQISGIPVTGRTFWKLNELSSLAADELWEWNEWLWMAEWRLDSMGHPIGVVIVYICKWLLILHVGSRWSASEHVTGYKRHNLYAIDFFNPRLLRGVNTYLIVCFIIIRDSKCKQKLSVEWK